MHSKHGFVFLRSLFLLFFMLLFLTGCGSSKESLPDKDPEVKARPNTPDVYVPEAPAASVLGSDPLVIDISNKNQGYIMARYTGTSAKANVQITGPDDISYKYFLLPGDSYVTLPLTAGSGAYEIEAYENIADSSYALLFREPVDVTLESELLPFLYPNQYVSFNTKTLAVKTASDVVKDASDDLDAVADIYHYVVKNITYDDEKAASVTAGYLPDTDHTLKVKKGICLDYASLTAAMLRSQGIPCRLEIGYAGKIYHAWIGVYIKDKGWIDKIIEFRSDTWTRMDPTFASGNNNSRQILKYIGDDSNYSLQYLR